MGTVLYTGSANNTANSVTLLKQRFSTSVLRLFGTFWHDRQRYTKISKFVKKACFHNVTVVNFILM